MWANDFQCASPMGAVRIVIRASFIVRLRPVGQAGGCMRGATGACVEEAAGACVEEVAGACVDDIV
jgi:hypothetical protein